MRGASPLVGTSRGPPKGLSRRESGGKKKRRPTLNGSSFVLLAELGHDAQVFESRGVAGTLAAGGDVAEEATHDLAAAGLGHRLGEPDVVGPRQGADLLDDVGAEFLTQLFGGGRTRVEGHEGG